MSGFRIFIAIVSFVQISTGVFAGVCMAFGPGPSCGSVCGAATLVGIGAITLTTQADGGWKWAVVVIQFLSAMWWMIGVVVTYDWFVMTPEFHPAMYVAMVIPVCGVITGVINSVCVAFL